MRKRGMWRRGTPTVSKPVPAIKAIFSSRVMAASHAPTWPSWGDNVLGGTCPAAGVFAATGAWWSLGPPAAQVASTIANTSGTPKWEADDQGAMMTMLDLLWAADAGQRRRSGEGFHQGSEFRV